MRTHLGVLRLVARHPFMATPLAKRAQARQATAVRQGARELLRFMKHHIDPKLVRLLDEHANVVADELAQHLVDHRHWRLAVHVIGTWP